MVEVLYQGRPREPPPPHTAARAKVTFDGVAHCIILFRRQGRLVLPITCSLLRDSLHVIHTIQLDAVAQHSVST